MHPIEVLERYWGYTSFKPFQEDIIASALNNDDVFALLPTGGGKSVCFQIPAIINDGICIVVSPLIALMRDQVNTLKQKGIKAMALTSGMSYSDLDTQLNNCIYGKYKFLYLSPERLQQPIVQARIQQMKVNLIAVDEAHCISQWGNDFRPAYRNISVLRGIHPHTNCMALTASAKYSIINDIITNLDFINPKIYKGSFNRPNISYKLIDTDDKLFHLEHILNTNKGPAIIYVRHRKTTKTIHSFLESKGFAATYYHGGIPNEAKADRLKLWQNESQRIMVATTAFGMGIDKANVKTIIHFNLPESIESYYQEAGRAGRNGDLAQAIILKQNIDEDHLKNQFLNTLPSIEFIKTVYKKLSNYFQIAFGEGENTTHQFNFQSFCTAYQLHPSMTYNALLVLDRNAIITLSQQFSFRTKIQFLTTNSYLFQYLETYTRLNTLVKVILRTYGGVFDYETKVNLNLIAQKADLPQKTLIAQLQQLQKDHIISLEIANTDSEITFLKPREDDSTIHTISKTINQQHKLRHKQIKAVLNYTNNSNDCRQKQILAYFGEQTKIRCGICSVCTEQNPAPDHTNISKAILNALLKEHLSSRQLLKILNCKETELLKSLSELIEGNKIKMTSNNTYTRI